MHRTDFAPSQNVAGSARSLPTKLETSPQISARMSRQRTAGTAPEAGLRRELFRRGFRYRVDYPLPTMPRRRADIAFTRAKVAVFVDGCFWHSCPEHGTAPKANAEWWAAKLARNVERDRDTDDRLRQAGWIVVRVWEHEPVHAAMVRVQEQVAQARNRRTRSSKTSASPVA